MTWKAIKKAVDYAGISEEDEGSVIECQPRDDRRSM
jgi:hypothetical protein